ncbi:MAG TPA: glutamate racemase [Xanthomonadales bacterium]|nr:glutamate racemase [Xanthomonadales bacterium]
MNNQPIGILDSGVGGLTIWNEIVSQLPNESTIYIADSLNCPYGNKDTDQVYNLAKRMMEFLLSKEVKLIVVACNSITVTCIDELRKDFPNTPIVGTVPVVKTAAKISRNKRIGILSTTRTAASTYQKDLIKKHAKDCEVFVHGTDELVPLIEEGKVTGVEIEKILREVMEKFKKEQIDTLALGCSHFPFLEKEIEKILGNDVLLLDSGGAIARQVKRVLEQNNSLAENSTKPHYKFFTTGELVPFKKIVKVIGKDKMTQNVDRISL